MEPELKYPASQMITIKRWGTLWLATIGIELISYACLGLYWWRSDQSDHRLVATWAGATWIATRTARTAIEWRLSSINNKILPYTQWIAYAALMIPAIALIYLVWK